MQTLSRIIPVTSVAVRPYVDNISPGFGSEAGGDAVLITLPYGGETVTAVEWNGVAGTLVSVAPTVVAAISPAGTVGFATITVRAGNQILRTLTQGSLTYEYTESGGLPESTRFVADFSFTTGTSDAACLDEDRFEVNGGNGAPIVVAATAGFPATMANVLRCRWADGISTGGGAILIHNLNLPEQQIGTQRTFRQYIKLVGDPEQNTHPIQTGDSTGDCVWEIGIRTVVDPVYDLVILTGRHSFPYTRWGDDLGPFDFDTVYRVEIIQDRLTETTYKLYPYIYLGDSLVPLYVPSDFHGIAPGADGRSIDDETFSVDDTKYFKELMVGINGIGGTEGTVSGADVHILEEGGFFVVDDENGGLIGLIYSALEEDWGRTP